MEDEIKTTNEELEVIASECLELNKPYTHCLECGKIYEGEYERPVIDHLRLTGKASDLESPFEKYNITSGYCPHCYTSELEKINGRSHHREEVNE